MAFGIQGSAFRGRTKGLLSLNAGCRILIPTLLLLLSACGFHPIYGGTDYSGTPVAAQMNAVAIDSIPDRAGQILRNALIDRMYAKGRPKQPAYRLHVTLTTSVADVGILANATSTLSDLDTTGAYTLTDAAGNQLLTGTAHSVTSYSRLDDQYATLAAHDSAVERTAREISEQIVNRLGVYFAEREPPPAP